MLVHVHVGHDVRDGRGMSGDDAVDSQNLIVGNDAAQMIGRAEAPSAHVSASLAHMLVLMSKVSAPTTLLARFANNLTQRWVRPKAEETLIGIDYKGNKYYEMIGANVQDRRLEGHVLPKRWYYPSDENQDDWDQYVPSEWEAWLRYRRIDAPTEEEVHLNLAVAYAKQLNAAKIMEEEQKRLQSPEQTSLPIPPDTETKMVQAVKDNEVRDGAEDVPYDRRTGKNPTRGFPLYEDYENMPDAGPIGEIREREAQRRNPFID